MYLENLTIHRHTRLNDFYIKNKIQHLLNIAILNLDSYNSRGNNRSLSLWRAYVSIEYAILVLKLTCNNNEIQPIVKPKKSNLRDAIKTKNIKMKRQDSNHVIRRLKIIRKYLNLQNKKLILRELRSNRDNIKNSLQK